MMTGFLQQTAESIVAKHGWNNLRQLTLVFPTRRAGLVLKNELKELQQQQHKAAVLLPNITTLNELFDALSPLYKEEELPMVCRLYQIYRETTGEDISLDIFYGWGRQMIADFSNIDKSIPPKDVESFFQNSIAAKELELLEVDEEVRTRLCDLINGGISSAAYTDDSIQHKFTCLWRNMYTIYRRLNEVLSNEKKGYEGARMRRVITEWSSLSNQYEGRQFVFVGFNYLMPVEKDLLLLLKERNQATFYWDYVENFTTNTKAFSFIQKHIQDLGNEAKPVLWSEAKDVHLIATTTANAQAQYAGEWLRGHYTRKGQRTAIVICDEQMLESVIYALPALSADSAEQEPINITKGFPLSSTRIYTDVMTYLRDLLRTGRFCGKNIALLDEVLDKVVVPAEQEAQKMTSATTLADTWQVLLIQESVYQTRLAINSFKRQLQTPFLSEAISSPVLLRNLLCRYMEGISLPFHGEPITDIQVMGVLETRMLDFDNLLLLNVEEGVVPQDKTDFSFIPYYLRKSFGMQTGEESASVYAYNFFRLLTRAGNITMLFSNADTAMGRKSMSRFVMQMMVSNQFCIHKYTLTENNHLQNVQLLDLTGSRLTMEEVLKNRAAQKIFTLSPSALNTYIECPRKFYLQYMMGIHEEEKETAVFAPNILGSFVHNAMEYIYKEFCDCSGCSVTAPIKIDPQVLKKVLDSEESLNQALRSAYTKMNKEYHNHHKSTDIGDKEEHYVEAEHCMENIVIKNFVRNILQRDIQDAKQGLQICLLEQPRKFNFTLESGMRITVGGTIDRLDKVGPEGACKMRVVDYKTGTYNTKKMNAKWDELFSDSEKNYVRQTLIYAATIEESEHPKVELEPNLFFTQKKLTGQTTTISVEGETVSDYRQLKDTFMPLLENKIQELFTTCDFPQTEAECSSFCPFLDICGREAKTF